MLKNLHCQKFVPIIIHIHKPTIKFFFEDKQHAHLIKKLIFKKNVEYLQKINNWNQGPLQKNLKLFNELINFFNYIKLWGKIICHTHKCGSPITSNTNVIMPIFNPQMQFLKVCDDISNTKDLFYFNLWPCNAKHLMG